MRLKTVALCSAVAVMPTIGFAVWPQPWTQLAALDFSAIERMGSFSPDVDH